MAEVAEKSQAADAPTAVTHVAPAPHLVRGRLTTRRMMIDVLIALSPAFAVAVYVFREFAVLQVAVCVTSCVAAEAVFTLMRGRRPTIDDFSAVVTGTILAFSLPATTPPWLSVIGSFAAIGIGKAVFGGLGQNIFNPAMVGRAFVMIAFAGFIAAGGYVNPQSRVDAITKATPMTVAKDAARKRAEADEAQAAAAAVTEAKAKAQAVLAAESKAAAAEKAEAELASLPSLLLGTTNGSVGETSAIALLLGGLYLCIRRTASWQLPAGAILGLLIVAGIQNLTDPGNPWTALHHLLGGAFMLGAFFIITDPVSSPLTPKGKWIFGLAFGVLVMLIRLLTSYPEGVMFSVLLVNAIAPLINRWTIPRPVGGPVPAKK